MRVFLPETKNSQGLQKSAKKGKFPKMEQIWLVSLCLLYLLLVGLLFPRYGEHPGRSFLYTYRAFSVIQLHDIFYKSHKKIQCFLVFFKILTKFEEKNVHCERRIIPGMVERFGKIRESSKSA